MQKDEVLEMEKTVNDLKSTLDSYNEEYKKKKKLTNRDIKEFFEIAITFFKFTATSYKRIAQLSEINRGLIDTSKGILGLLKKLSTTIFFIVLILVFKDNIATLLSKWFIFAFDGWGKINLEVKYGFIVITPVSLLLGIFGKWLRKKIKA